MALSTYAGVTAAIAAGQSWKTMWSKTSAATYAAGYWYNTFALSGFPSAGSYAGSALAATPLYGSIGSWGSPNAGYLPTGGNVGSYPATTNFVKHLYNLEMSTVTATGAPGWLVLVDLLMAYAGLDFNSGSQQTLNNTLTLPRYTNGVGVMMFLEVTTALGATAVSLSSALTVPADGFVYTNSAGTGSRYIPGTVAIGTAAASRAVQSIPYSGIAANNFGPFIPLAAGDGGVQSVQFFQLTAGTGSASNCALVLCKPLATIPLISSAAGNVTATVRDYLFNMPALPTIVDGACLSFLYCPGQAAASATIQGMLDFVWG